MKYEQHLNIYLGRFFNTAAGCAGLGSREEHYISASTCRPRYVRCTANGLDTFFTCRKQKFFLLRNALPDPSVTARYWMCPFQIRKCLSGTRMTHDRYLALPVCAKLNWNSNSECFGYRDARLQLVWSFSPCACALYPYPCVAAFQESAGPVFESRSFGRLWPRPFKFALK